jgi:hypothetical protein
MMIMYECGICVSHISKLSTGLKNEDMQKSRVVNFLFPVILKIMPLRNTRKGGSTKEIKIGRRRH